MLGYIFLGALAAFGLLSGLWAMFGWLLPGGRGSVSIFFCRPGQAEDWALSRYCCLRDFGLLQGPLLIVGSSLPPEDQERLRQRHDGIEFCGLEDLPSRLEREWEQLG